MKEKNVIEFYVLCNKLKDCIRTGWKDWNVKRDRVESVAEHIYGTTMLAIAMWSEYDYKIDIKKAIMMLCCHELEEVFLGDLTLFEIGVKDKQKMGHDAVEKLLSGLLKKDEIKSLVFEFDERKTDEAKFAFFCDKLECDIQSKLYDEEKCVDLNDQKNNEIMNNEHVKNLLNQTNGWSHAWIKFGQERYHYDDNFLEVSNYLLNNDISKIKKC